MLRKLRLILATLCFIGINLIFLGLGQDWFGWLPKVQALPAALRLIGSATVGNIAVVLCILLLTLILGRLYCSVLCPLGICQDIVIWFRRTLSRIFPKSKAIRKRFHFNKERWWVRYPVAVLLIVCIIADLQVVVALLGPYSAYGRMIRGIIGGGPAPLLIAALVTLVIIVLCAWLWGRAYCNTFCPVGTVLGCISKFQILGPVVDEDKCIKCGACSRGCKASCIEEGTLVIDRSRCVDCFDCIDLCKQKAISFGRTETLGGGKKQKPAAKEENDKPGQNGKEGRRAFIATGAMLLGTGIAASAQNMKVDGGLAVLEPKQATERKPRLVPPGAVSVNNFYDKCTACQLCITHCPNDVLRPSTDLEHFLQPQMGYENGFCRPECTACSDVCPSGAIISLKPGAKSLIHIGTAVVNPFICLSASGEEKCGACARHCPTGAITMVEVDGNMRPAVSEEQCIGCGKCEYLCPVRPISAITVKGLEIHIND